jgi:hypothetical protein
MILSGMNFNVITFKMKSVLYWLLIILYSSCPQFLFAQKVVRIADSKPHHILTFNEIQAFEDKTGKLSIQEISVKDFEGEFVSNKIYTPKILNSKSHYWYKIKIGLNAESSNHWILEFFDQTIDSLELFELLRDGNYKRHIYGDHLNFSQREYSHKNFVYSLDNSTNSEKTFYLRIQSSQPASVIVVLRNIKWFVKYSNEEYLFFGLFYGMIVVFGFYNLLMYFAIRHKQYLYYVLYNLSIGFYEMCIDGIAFQYLWPNQPHLNEYMYGTALFCSSVFGLFFTSSFLYLKSKAPLLNNLIIGIIVLRVLFFICCLYNTHLFIYKIIEIIPLIVALATGIYIWKSGYRPARFFVIGYSALLLGFTLKILVLFNVSWLPYGPITHYSLSFCFVVEMILVSFAIGDNVRHLRKKKDKVQKRMINQLKVNEKLKDTLNKELTSLVDERTKEVIEKAQIIENQNTELSEVNKILKQQAEQISQMNALLKKDNQELTVNIEKVSRARVMSKEVDFEEFSKIYPDRDTCFKYLSELKWEKGYSCKRCGNTNHLAGQLPFSRRCTKCRYEESVIAYTIFHNSRIPINKAFYMLFLVYTSKGKISSHKLSEIISIRQSTCWSYSSKMKKVMEDRKKELRNSGEKWWAKLVLGHEEQEKKEKIEV